MGLTWHMVPGVAFDGLADGLGDLAAVRHLAATQLDRHRARLLLVCNLADQNAAAAADARLVDAVNVIDMVESCAPEVVAEILRMPHIGAWSAHCAAVMHGSRESPVPLSVDLGHLSAIAAACAIRANVETELTVPIRDGVVTLPTLGSAHMGTGTAPAGATVSVAGGGFTVNGPDRSVFVGTDGHDVEWHPTPRLAVGTGSLRLEICMEDSDPFRAARTLRASELLTPESVRTWTRLLDEAWTILCTRHPPYAQGIAAVLNTLVPLGGYPANRGISAASRDAFGAVALTLPSSPQQMAVTLLHEAQHAKLGALLDLVRLNSADPNRYCAPWRDDPRPLEGLMQGAYAFLGVVDFWRIERAAEPGNPEPHFEFARWRDPLLRTLDVIAGSARLTPAGERFVTRMRTRVVAWQDETVPPDIAVLAEAADLDHDASWRLRNLRHSADTVDRLAHLYLAGQPVPAEPYDAPTVDQRAGQRENHNRQELVGLRLRQPQRFDTFTADPALARSAVPGCDEGDILYALDDLAAAQAHYLAQIAAEPDRVEPWAGLAVIAHRGGTPGVADHLPMAYQLFRQLREQTAPVSPVDLCRWLAGADGQGAGGSMSHSARLPSLAATVSG